MDFVVCVTDTDREAASLKHRFKFDDAEEFHAVLRDSILLAHGSDMAQGQHFDECRYYLVMGDRAMGCSLRPAS